MFHAPVSKAKAQSPAGKSTAALEPGRTAHPHNAQRLQTQAMSRGLAWPGMAQPDAPPPRPLQWSIGNQAALGMLSQTTPRIQTKLTINQPGDRYEQEADQVADHVMRMSVPGQVALPVTSASAGPNLQRKCACGGTCDDCKKKSSEHEHTHIQRKQVSGNTSGPAAAPPIVHEVLRSPGQPLDPAIRAFMEPRFGRDFSHVRVHSGPTAEKSARDVNAHAYAFDTHIVFGPNKYSPTTLAGKHLLAHELSHVVQQTGVHGKGKSPEQIQRSFKDKLNWLATTTGDLIGEPEVGKMIASQSIEENIVLGLSTVPIVGNEVKKHKQVYLDLMASVEESPQHVLEFLTGELWDSIKAHWVQIVLVTGGILLAESITGALVAAPEPIVTKVVAAILQIALLAVLGYFAKVELQGVNEEANKWIKAAAQANGNPIQITEASRSFVRMIWHILLAVLTVAGVRAKLRGVTSAVSRVAAASPGAGVEALDATASGGSGAAKGGDFTPISKGYEYRASRGTSQSGGPASYTAGTRNVNPYLGFGNAAQELFYDPQPIIELEPPIPEPSPALQPTPTPVPAPAGPGLPVRYIPAVAAGLSSATTLVSAPTPATTPTPSKLATPVPQSKPKPDKKKKEKKDCELTLREVARGDDQLATLFCSFVSRGGRSYDIWSRAGNAEIDALRGRTWYECKCGHRSLIEAYEGGERWAISHFHGSKEKGTPVAQKDSKKPKKGTKKPRKSKKQKRFKHGQDEQLVRHVRIAAHCGYNYILVVASEEVAEFFRDRYTGVHVEVVDFDPCE